MTEQGFTRPPIWTLPRRGGLLIAAEREYKGAVFFELRQWANGGDTPTRDGVTVPLSAVTELAQAMLAYAQELPPERG